MIMCAALVFAVNILSTPDNEGVINGLDCELTVFSFGDKVYTEVKFTQASDKEDSYFIRLDLAVECINAEGAVSDREERAFEFNPLNPDSVDYHLMIMILLKLDAILKAAERKSY